MVHRFKIEDLVDQDASGVVFRAFDSETQQTVALRRFFPHGPDGDGLSADEQVAYRITLDRLIGIHHPALRSIICGGCDPVDGIPFIATEWIDGVSLPLFLETTPLTVDESADLLGKALELCQLLSEVLAEEAVWMETDLRSIVVGADGSGRGVTFSISPFTWQGASIRKRGLEHIIVLCEEIMGWNGKAVSDHAAKGLGGWLRWLRGAAATTSLHETRENLAASLGVTPPVPAKRLVRMAAMQAPTKKRPSRRPLWIVMLCLLFAIAGGTWAWLRKNEKLPAPPANAAEKIMDFESFKLQSTLGELPAAVEVTAATANDSLERTLRTEVFTPLDREGLIEKTGVEVILEGTLGEFNYSEARTLMYLVFAENSSTTAPRGEIRTRNAADDLSETALKSLINKKIRLQGHVKMSNNRPVIYITERAAISEVGE